MTVNYYLTKGRQLRCDTISPRASSDSAVDRLANKSNRFTRLLSSLVDGVHHKWGLAKSSAAIGIFVALAGSSCSVDNNDAYREYFPKADGDKPAEFKFGYKNSCTTASAKDLETYLSSVEAFATSRHMLRILPTKNNSKILMSYARGAPMRVHLLVKRMDDGEVAIGISTLSGLDCDDCAAARSIQFRCPSYDDNEVTN